MTPFEPTTHPQPITEDRLFETLCAVTDVFEALGLPYLLTGGTLLGAIREGDIIKNDIDLDFDFLGSDIVKLEGAKQGLIDQGIVLDIGQTRRVIPFKNPALTATTCARDIVKIYDLHGQPLGDICGYHLFSDGILRQINVETGAYFNAKMSFPMWFFENVQWATIRGRQFRVPAEPELYLNRVYGDHWRTPIARNDRKNIPAGYGSSGARLDADLETAIAEAKERGWSGYYPNATPWPMHINYVSDRRDTRWINLHENFDGLDESTNPAHVASLTAELARLKSRLERVESVVKVKNARIRKLENRLKEQSK